MNILTHDEAKRLSQSSTDPLEVIRNVEAAVIIKLAGSQVALKDEIRLIWQPKCDALRQQLEAARNIGNRLSNVAFNWVQQPGRALNDLDVAMLDNLRREWDAATKGTDHG